MHRHVDRSVLADEAPEDLADRYMRLAEDHRNLKEERNEQNERIKFMTTKFMRIVADLKRSGATVAEDGTVLQLGRIDRDADQYIGMLQQQVKTLKRANEVLQGDCATLEKRLEKARKAAMPHPSEYRKGPGGGPPAPANGPHSARPSRTGVPAKVRPPAPKSPAAYVEHHRQAALAPRAPVPLVANPADHQTVPSDPPGVCLASTASQTPAFELLLQQFIPRPPAPIPRTSADAGVQCALESSDVVKQPKDGLSSDAADAFLGDEFLGGDPHHQKEYVMRLHALVDTLRQKFEDSQATIQTMRFEAASMVKERDGALRQLNGLSAQTAGEEHAHMADLVALQRELKEKNAKLVLLHGRFQQAEAQINASRDTHAGILADMRTLNSQLGEERRRTLELERELQLARLGEDRHHDNSALLADLRAEKRAVEEENSRLVQQLLMQQTATESDLRRDFEEQVRTLEASVAQWEATSRRQFQDLRALETRYEAVLTEHKATREAKIRLEQQLTKLQSDHQLLAERMQIMAALEEGEQRPEDLDKALALVRAARLKGQPTDLEFLLPIFDRQTGGTLEVDHMRAENANLLRDLATSQKFIEVLKQRLEASEKRDQERLRELQTGIDQLQSQGQAAKQSDGRIIQAQLERILHLEANVSTMKQQLGTRLSVDVPLRQLAADENLIEVYVGHMRLERTYLEAHGITCPPSVFISVDFLEHATQMTDVKADLSPVFDNTYMYTTQVNEFLLYYLQTKTLNLDLHRATGSGGCVSLAKAAVPLFDLLRPAGLLRGFAVLLSPDRQRVGQLEYTITVRKPLPPQWLLEASEAQRTGLGRAPLTLDDQAAEGFYHRLSDVASVTVSVTDCADLQCPKGPDGCAPYATYTFFHHPDVTVEQLVPDTCTLTPVFHHARTFPCAISLPLLSYLMFGSLPVAVFNNLDDDEEAYLGMVLVPLKPLLEGPSARVAGDFPLRDPSGQPGGTIRLSIWWNPKEILTLDAELAMSQLGMQTR